MSRFGYRSMVHAVAVTFFPKTTAIQRRESMQTRRGFLKTVTAGTAGALLPGRGRAGLAAQSRRRVTIGGRPVKVIDAHAHCVIPVTDIVQGSPLAKMGGGASANLLGPQRLQVMDEQGVDVQALTINGFWWYAAADRGLADRIVRAQNEGLAKWVAQHPDRFVALASVALQYPEHAAAQLEDGVKRLGLRGASIGGHVNGEDLSLPKYDPFWAKAAELGVLVVMHPGGAENIIKDGALRGRGDLGSIIGNPLETTYFLSQLIFDGVFDKFPGLRLCAVHAGGLACGADECPRGNGNGPGLVRRHDLRRRPDDHSARRWTSDLHRRTAGFDSRPQSGGQSVPGARQRSGPHDVQPQGAGGSPIQRGRRHRAAGEANA